MRWVVPIVVVGVALPAHAQFDGSVDAQMRRPTLGPRDATLVRGAGAPPHLATALGLDFDVVRRPVVARDDVVGTERPAVTTRLTTTVLYGLGLADRGRLVLAVPFVFHDGQGRAAFAPTEDEPLPPAVAGDVRLDFAWSLLEPTADEPWGVGVASGLSLPTGDDTAFAGAPGVGGTIAAFGERGIGPLRLMAEVGARVREDSEVGDTRVGSELALAGAALVDVIEGRLSVGLSGLVLVGLVAGSSAPAVGMLEAWVRLLRREPLVLGLAAGAGYGDALTTPAWELVASIRHVPEG